MPGLRSMVVLGLMVGIGACKAECPPPPPPAPAAAPGIRVDPPGLGETSGTVGAVVLDPAAAKRHRLDLTLAQVDGALHGIRLDYRTDSGYGWAWTWPTWLPPERIGEVFASLEAIARQPPALPAIDAAVVRYVADVRPLATRLRALVIESSPAERVPDAPPPVPVSVDQVEPVFARLRAASRAVHAALRAGPTLPATPNGATITLARWCLEASEALDDLPSAWIAAEATDGAADAPLDVAELRARARRCMTAAIDVLATPGGDLTAADFGLGVGNALLRDLERVRTHSKVSWGSSIGQSMMYLAARGIQALDAPPSPAGRQP